MMVAAANERIADAWEWADWPELMRVEARTVQGDSTTGYYIDSAQSGETAMGEVFSVMRDNPETHVAPREIAYTLLEDRIVFPDATSIPATVYVRYRLRPTVYTADNLSAAVPSVIAKAVGLQLAADLQAEDGQLDKSQVYEMQAENDLVNQRDKYVFQQGQTQAWTARIRGFKH